MILPTGKWGDLKFFQSGEWQVVEERLEDLRVLGRTINPEKKNLFAALKATPFEKVKVVILGQDPYPTHAHASGIAFSVTTKDIPPTLSMIFQELTTDLGIPRPTSGDLTKWCDQGVLLWNVIPTCESGRSMAHASWEEWEFLTEEILKKLSEETSAIFVSFGSIAQKYMERFVDSKDSVKLFVSHPSPRGNKFSKHPFLGSRIFSTINSKLVGEGLEPIDWRL